MLRKLLLGLAFGLAASCACAQPAPSPADVGIVKGTTDSFKLKDSSDQWVPFGTSTGHVFTPVGGGAGGGGAINVPPAGTTPINGTCPTGQFLYNNAGNVDCVAISGGGATGTLTLYPTHSLLVSGVSVPSGSSASIIQQGFYVAGDGGAATYQWNASALCPFNSDTGLNPTDDINCIAPGHPAPYTSSTPGRYLLQLGNGIDVRQVGMLGDGVFDNSALNDRLMNVINPASTQGSGMDVFFPAKAGQRYTDYYFSQPLHVYRLANIRCQGVPNGGGDGSTRLKFPAGVHGVVFDNYSSSPVGTGDGGGGMDGCSVISNGFHEGFNATTGSGVLTGVVVDKWYNSWDFEVNDGIIAFMSAYSSPGSWAPLGPGGTIATGVNSSTHTLTLNATLASGLSGVGTSLWRLPVEKRFTVQTVSGNPNVTVTAGPSRLLPGDFIWSDAFPFGSVVLDAYASSLFTETSTNNFAAGDHITVGNVTRTFVSTLNGSGAGSVKRGANFAASAANLVSSINGGDNTAAATFTGTISGTTLMVSGVTGTIAIDQYVYGASPGTFITGGSGSTWTVNTSQTVGPVAMDGLWYIPTAPAPNVTALTGTWPGSATSINFTASPNTYAAAYASTYTPSGTSAGSFQATTLTNQTVTLTQYDMDYNNTLNASTGHSSGSPGYMWIIPAAIKTYVQTSFKRNYLTSFGFGLEMECSFWSATLKAGCNGSMAEENVFGLDIIGRLVMGDNSGASASIMNVYSNNTFSDIVEGGAVGSTYFAENTNSPEASTSVYGIVGECINSNSSSFFGGYNSSFTGYCLNGSWTAPSTSGGSVVFWNNQAATPAGAPAVYNSNFVNRWYFAGNDSASTQLCMNEPNAPLSFSRANQSCGGPDTWSLGYAGSGFWAWDFYSISGGNPMLFTEGALGGYTGYKAGNLALMSFQQGVLLYDTETGGEELELNASWI